MLVVKIKWSDERESGLTFVKSFVNIRALLVSLSNGTITAKPTGV
jgi:hypothetical protein